MDRPPVHELSAVNAHSLRFKYRATPEIVTKALRTEVPHPVPMSCEIVRAAIAGFGKQITRIGVARTVYAAVQASPGETLSIVSVAIEDTPPALHRDVVGAAIAAVPDPYACVSPNSLHYMPCNSVPTPALNRQSMLHSDSEAEHQAIVFHTDPTRTVQRTHSGGSHITGSSSQRSDRNRIRSLSLPWYR